MRKIPTMFVRYTANMAMVTPEVTEGCEWVMEGEGVATEKYDGTACLVRNGELYKRHRLKTGKPMPTGWLHWSFDPEQTTGYGWLPVVAGQPENQYHVEAFEGGVPGDKTYELVGPKVQRNPYKLPIHVLWTHGVQVPDDDAPARTFEGIRDYLAKRYIEGIVFHHPDGRMAKIKRRDFGYQWPPRAEVT